MWLNFFAILPVLRTLLCKFFIAISSCKRGSKVRGLGNVVRSVCDVFNYKSVLLCSWIFCKLLPFISKHHLRAVAIARGLLEQGFIQIIDFSIAEN